MLEPCNASISYAKLYPLVVVTTCLLVLASCTRHENSTSPTSVFLDPNVAVYLDHAIQALRQEMPAQALVLADSALVYAPYHPYAHFVRGQAYYVLERFDEARAAWDQTLDLEPENWAWWQSVGDVAFQQQDFPASLAHYRRAAQMHPDPISWHGMAGAYWEIGQADSARFACRQALRVDSTYAPAYASLSDLAEEEGDFPTALKYAEAALHLVPENNHYRYAVGLMLMKNGRGNEAVDALRGVLTTRSEDVNVLHSLGQALVLTGQKEEAFYYFTKADSLRKKNEEKQ